MVTCRSSKNQPNKVKNGVFGKKVGLPTVSSVLHARNEVHSPQAHPTPKGSPQGRRPTAPPRGRPNDSENKQNVREQPKSHRGPKGPATSPFGYAPASLGCLPNTRKEGELWHPIFTEHTNSPRRTFHHAEASAKSHFSARKLIEEPEP
jgi:hypothetical protein